MFGVTTATAVGASYTQACLDLKLRSTSRVY